MPTVAGKEYPYTPEGIAAARLAQAGRNEDNALLGGEVAHISGADADLLRSRGGAGTINPVTGLREYYVSDPNLPPGITRNPGGSYSAHPAVVANLPGATLADKVDIFKKEKDRVDAAFQAPHLEGQRQAAAASIPSAGFFPKNIIAAALSAAGALPEAPTPSAASLYVDPPADYRPGIDPMWDYFSTTNQYPMPIAEETVAYEAPAGDGGYREEIESIYRQHAPSIANYFPSWAGQGALGTLLSTPATILEEELANIPGYNEAFASGTEPYTVL